MNIDNPILTPEENAAVHEINLDPGDFAVILAKAQFDGRQGGLMLAQVQTPSGPVDCVIIPALIPVPMSTLKKQSSVMLANGAPQNPLEGVLPTFITRVVVPKAALAQRPQLVIPFANTDFPES